MQRRLVLMLNHVLQQEPEAQARLKRQAGWVMEAHWRNFNVRLQATPAGLLDLGPVTQIPDLQLTPLEKRDLALGILRGRGAKLSAVVERLWSELEIGRDGWIVGFGGEVVHQRDE